MDTKNPNGRVYKTAYLPTDEEKVAKLQGLLRARPHQGDFLLPNQAFYEMDLNGMARAMLEWIGISSRNRLFVGYKQNFEAAGLGDAAGVYMEQGGIHYVLLNPAKVKTPYQAAAVVVHQLMHYVLMGIGGLTLDDDWDNEKFTDIATVMAGLGVIVANGFGYKSGKKLAAGIWTYGLIRGKGRKLAIGCSTPKEYARMVKDYAKSYDITYDHYAGYLLPWTKRFLPRGLKRASRVVAKKSDLASAMRKSLRTQRALATVAAIVLMVAVVPMSLTALTAMPGVASKVSASALVAKVQGRLGQQTARLESLQNHVEACTNSLSSRRDQINQDDLKALDAYNAEVASCNNLRSQYNSEVASYNAKFK